MIVIRQNAVILIREAVQDKNAGETPPVGVELRLRDPGEVRVDELHYPVIGDACICRKAA